MVIEQIKKRQSGIITYGITPPKLNNTHEKVLEIAAKQRERIAGLPIDGLIIYDIQDETARTDMERPFPFLPTLDPVDYHQNYLSGLTVPKIIYRCVGKYNPQQFQEWLTDDCNPQDLLVFVGASSKRQAVRLKLAEAYRVSRQSNPGLIFGGVAIPERHMGKNDEHLRIVDKMKNGCQFFVTQAVYNVEAAKNFLSDYYYHCETMGLDMAPVLFTVTPCGSLKTLEFMKWLGISIPRWLENDLLHSVDILDKSVSLVREVFLELYDFAVEKGIPIGWNIESVSIRKAEIEASVQLVNDIRNKIMKCSYPS